MQVIDSLKAGHQAMVFVHSRKDTGKTGRTIIQKAQNSSDTTIFDVTEHPQWAFVSRDVKKSRNKCVSLHHCFQPMLTACAWHDVVALMCAVVLRWQCQFLSTASAE